MKQPEASLQKSNVGIGADSTGEFVDTASTVNDYCVQCELYCLCKQLEPACISQVSK